MRVRVRVRVSPHPNPNPNPDQVRRVVWLVIGYVRLSLIYVWYGLMVLAWEQHCWSESCAACPPGAAESLCTSYRTNCHVDPTTVAKGLPVWWLFAMYARSTKTLSLTLT